MVYSVNASDVRTVMVAGKVVVEERQVNTLDAKAILAEARRYGDSVRAYKTGSPNSRRGSYYFMTRQNFWGPPRAPSGTNPAAHVRCVTLIRR